MKFKTRSPQNGAAPQQAAGQDSAVQDDAAEKGVAKVDPAPHDSAKTDPAQDEPARSDSVPNASPQDGAVDAPSQKLLEVAAANGSFVKFGEAVDKAGLADTLSSNVPYTIFAPTDKAFERLPEGRLQHLFDPANKEELVSVLNYHIVKGRRSMADVGKWQSARTVQGQAAPIKTDGIDIRIDGAQVLFADIASTNGFIHGIDTVNMPGASATNVRPINGATV